MYVLDALCTEETEDGMMNLMSAMDRYFTRDTAKKALQDLRRARDEGFGGSGFPYESAGGREIWIYWEKRTGEVYARWWLWLPDDEMGVYETLISLGKMKGARARLLGGNGSWLDISIVRKAVENTVLRLSGRE
jgi:hypothetical protein